VSAIPISLPRSKSIVIRALIVHYLKTGTLLPVFAHDPNDIMVVYNALKVIDSNKKAPIDGECVIDVEDCGAAFRFLMAALATTKGKWLLTGTKRLLQRPILPLVNFLNFRGAKIQQTKSGWHIEGEELKIDDFEIDTSETSQFASAVMMVWGERRKQKAESRKQKGEQSPSNFEGVPEGRGHLYLNPYIEMTRSILQIPNLAVSPLLGYADWSAAVFWLARALLTPNAHYLLKNLHIDGVQGDAVMAKWFAKWGLDFTEHDNGIEVKHTHHYEIPKQSIDVAQTPDIAMILAVLATCYPFQLTLSGLKNINLKESNRLDILVHELSRFTTINKHSGNKITIHRRIREMPNSFHLDSYNDHRFVMAWSLFKNFGTVIIKNADCVKKSYPQLI
jgi:3-phosphoshikimate 1-carboxyvinyltransferase